MKYISRETTPQGNPIIQVGFFRATPSWWSCGPLNATYEHVELRFSDGTITSITRDPGTIHYEQGRMLSNPNYRCFFQIAIDTKEEEYIQGLAKKCADSADMRFSYMAMIWNFAPITRNWPINGVFCSQYITMLLQHIRIATDLNPLTTSPDDLFHTLKRDKRAIASYNRNLFTF